MANNPPKKPAALSKKHLDRLHREKQQIRWITIGAIVVILLVIGSIGYGILDQQVLQRLALRRRSQWREDLGQRIPGLSPSITAIN